MRAGGQGRSKLGPPIANSCVESLPTTIAPAARSLLTQTASAVADVALEDLRMAGRRQARDVDDVLDADRHAVQRPAQPARRRLGLGDLAPP